MTRSATTVNPWPTTSGIARFRESSFDPDLPGTAESRWRSILSTAPGWCPEAGPLLVVSPHPDDEILGAGGLIRTWCTLGYPVTLVSVTDGEAAHPDWRGLADVRRRELVEALSILCNASLTTVRLGLPDGGTRDHAGTLFSALSRLLSNEPTVIAPYEWDGHPDHEVTGAVCLELARLHRLPIARYPIWAWHHGDPDAFAGQHVGRFDLDPETQCAKAAAIQAFASQLRPPARQPIVPAHVLPYFTRSFETFLHD